MKLPNAQFLHSMGMASIIAGAILLGLAAMARRPRVKRVVRKVNR